MIMITTMITLQQDLELGSREAVSGVLGWRGDEGATAKRDQHTPFWSEPNSPGKDSISQNFTSKKCAEPL